MNRIAALTAAVAVTTALAPASLAGAKTTEATFNHRANGICSATGTKIEALPATDEKNLVKQFQAEVKIMNTMIKKLNGVEAPAASKRQWRRFISIQRQQVTLVGQALGQARAHHVDATANLLFKVVKLGQTSYDVATDLDLAACAQDYYPGASSPAAG
jgi:hypothetical protein